MCSKKGEKITKRRRENEEKMKEDEKKKRKRKKSKKEGSKMCWRRMEDAVAGAWMFFILERECPPSL